MTTLLFCGAGLCAFSSLVMGLTSLVDFSNKDIKMGGKNKKGVVNDEIESFREDFGRKHIVR